MQPMHESRDTQIQRLYEQGMSQREIAELYGISGPRVNQILQKVGFDAESRTRKSSAGDVSEAVLAFSSEYGEMVRHLASQGITRAGVIDRFQLILPSVDIVVVGKGISAAGAIFEHWHTPDGALFPERAMKSSIWYLLGRSLGVEEDPKAALATDDFDEMRELSEILDRQGLDRPAIASVVRLIAATRLYHRDNPDAMITRKRHDDIRLQVLSEWGVAAGVATRAWPLASVTVIRRLGGGYWADALRKIGLSPSLKGRRRGHLKYQEDDYDSAVLDYFRYSGMHEQRPSIQGYERWVDIESRSGYDRPAWASLRLRYETWSEVRRFAAKSVDNQSPKTNRMPQSAIALHEAKHSWSRFIEEIDSAPQVKVSAITRNFLCAYVAEFELQRRRWLRSVLDADVGASSRLLDADIISRKLRGLLEQGVTPSAAISDRYIDALGAGDPRLTDGLLRPEVQAELDSLPDEVALQYKLLKAVRNFFTHTSAESEQSVRTAIDNLSGLDPRFALNQAITTRTLSDWLRARDFQRLILLCGSVHELWRAKVVGEAVLRAV
ncbi:hypothetical protein FDA94_05300 [Herbidospora galbida]|uniref:RNA polymerase sigma-70 region 4 domain-containing protein n=1 Tax=Herbidospora galbida TaxID=2575442 RepID=A0A4U3MNI3_9ACTN|nr:hypothetical protein [Herbidospora galbida]TKK90419.1 hypothetical protein FDA94_05300 [Herbidospora galbida]